METWFSYCSNVTGLKGPEVSNPGNSRVSGPKVSETLPIVLVYIGQRIPSYVLRSIRWIHSLAPTNPIILICNKEAGLRLNLKLESMALAFLEDLANESTIDYSGLRGGLRDWQFQDKKFWQFTVERIFWLSAWYERHKEQYLGFIHFEADSIPLLPINFLEKSIDFSTDSVWIPRQNSKEGCASLIIVSGYQTWSKMIKMFEVEFSPSLHTTDMLLLGRALSEPEIGTRELGRSSNSSSFLFFDPVTYGPYFLGFDARHDRLAFSRKCIKANDPSSEQIDGLRWDISFDVRNKSIVVKQAGKKSLLFNIHVHNKMIPRHTLLARFFFYRRLKYHKQIPNLRFDKLVALERIWTRIARIADRRAEDKKLR